MKQFLIISIFIVLASSALAQNSAVRDIQVLPVCWAAGAQVDSSIYAYWLMSSRDEIPRVVSYLNAAGQEVDVSAGGAISSGHCCCSGSSGGSTVTIIDNTDGTYTAVVDGDTTILNTNANTSYVTIPISVGDTVFLSGSNVQEILSAISTEVRQIRSRTGCDLLVVQSANGFDEGDLLAQDSTTGAFYLSSSDSTHNWPVGYVCEKSGPDSFYVDTEGWLVGDHPFPIYRDFFNQDTAGVATVPGTIQQFAFRTFSDSLRYFDIPEYAVDGAGGLGSGDNWGDQVVVSDATLTGDGTAGNPLSVVQDRDWVKSGPGDITPYDVNDNIWTDGLVAIGSVPRPHRFFVSLNTGGNDVRFGDSNKENDLNFVKNINGVWIKNGNDFGSNYAAILFRGSNGSVAPTNGSLEFYSGGTLTMRNLDGRIILDNVPDYVSDAAADADVNLITGSIYTVTAEDRTLRIKP